MELEKLRAALAGREPGLMDAVRRYAVLVPLVRGTDGLSLLYEVRARGLRRQPGEVCFPGGAMEPGEGPEQCALRETWEELGISREKIQILGRLDFIAHRAGFILYPVLGLLDGDAQIEANPAEVEEHFLAPLARLLEAEPWTYSFPLLPAPEEDFPYGLLGLSPDYRWQPGREEFPVYLWQGHAVWGMTGRITRRLLELI